MTQPKAIATGASTRRRRAAGASRGSWEQVQAVANLEQPRRADAYGREQHQALEQRLPERVEIEDKQEVADR